MTVSLNVTQVLVMAEDRINNPKFSNIKAILGTLTKLYVHNHTWSYILSLSFMKFSLSLSLSLADAQLSGHQFFSQFMTFL